jgi:nitroimidazol reductase NimA-like FMN-containing flavoprotein (pyridoxamine 5'-phosphate oxidase superfamily)
MIMKPRNGSDYSPDDAVIEHLEGYVAPLRLAVVDESGFPLICSLWFHYRDGRIYCATAQASRIAECLRRNPKCGFELAPNRPPYFGVRGRGRATVSSEGGDELLGRLVDRYIETRESAFSKWLLGRDAEEVVIEIEIEWTTSWNYSDRMSK